MNLEYQTLPFDNLQLTSKEKVDLISFMLALTDKEGNQ
jgi:cytochrome c peroxidase